MLMQLFHAHIFETRKVFSRLVQNLPFRNSKILFLVLFISDLTSGQLVVYSVLNKRSSSKVYFLDF